MTDERAKLIKDTWRQVRHKLLPLVTQRGGAQTAVRKYRPLPPTYDAPVALEGDDTMVEVLTFVLRANPRRVECEGVAVEVLTS